MLELNKIKKRSIKIRGNCFTFLVLYLLNDNINIVKHDIQNKINQLSDSFHHAPVILNVSALSRTVNWIKMKKAILSTGLNIIGVIESQDNILNNMIINSGLFILSNHKKNEIQKKYILFKENFSKNKKKIDNQTLIINQPIRSGQKIYAKNKDLIITNHVSPGAELISDGNVHIYGIMRGRVLAGAKGDYSKQIFCTHFCSELTSIGGEYWLIDHIPSNYIGKSVIICLKNGSLKIRLMH